MPNESTLGVMSARYRRSVTTLSQTDFQSIPTGADVPDSSQDASDFDLALRAIYGPPATPCTQQLDVKTGDLI